MAEKPQDIPYTLRASIRHENEAVSIHWVVDGYETKPGEPPRFESYQVARSALYGCAEKAREALSQLQDSAGGFDEGTRNVESLAAVRRLAWVGAELYGIVTQGRPGDPASQGAAKEFMDWFTDVVEGEAKHGEWRIQIEHWNYSEEILPWGLVFQPPKDQSIDDLDGSFESFGGFWCLAYYLACSGPTQQETARRLREPRRFNMGAILEIDEQEVNEFFEKGIVDRDEFGDMISTSTRSVKTMSKREPNVNKFWYFNLHASGGMYKLAGENLDNSFVSTTDLGIRDEGVGMMLLDGDAVIRGSRGSEWVKKILEAPRTGLIAVETDITNENLKYFGWDILKCILEQNDLFIFAIHNARKEYWPLSLLYGVYSNPLHIYATPPHKATKRISEYLRFVKERGGD